MPVNTQKYTQWKTLYVALSEPQILEWAVFRCPPKSQPLLTVPVLSLGQRGRRR